MMIVTWNETFTGEDQIVKLDASGVQDAVNQINASNYDEMAEIGGLGLKVKHHEWNGLNQCTAIVEYNVATGNNVERWNGMMTFHLTATGRPDLEIGEWSAV